MIKANWKSAGKNCQSGDEFRWPWPDEPQELAGWVISLELVSQVVSGRARLSAVPSRADIDGALAPEERRASTEKSFVGQF